MKISFTKTVEGILSSFNQKKYAMQQLFLSKSSIIICARIMLTNSDINHNWQGNLPCNSTKITITLHNHHHTKKKQDEQGNILVYRFFMDSMGIHGTFKLFISNSYNPKWRNSFLFIYLILILKFIGTGGTCTYIYIYIQDVM